MFDEITFGKIKRLPKYLFSTINEIKLEMRQKGIDVIDFSMGNPDGMPPKAVIDKLCESARKPKTQGYSVSRGIYKLRVALAEWYKRRFNVTLDPNLEVCVSMGSKEGFVHLVQAITNPGDLAIVPEPAYPIHYHAFIINGANVSTFPLSYTENYELNEDVFFESLQKSLYESFPKPKFVVVNFPHNPTSVIVNKGFYERLVALAKKERFYIISDIAYAELYFGDFRTPSIFEVKGAKDVAVETYTLSKSYNMAGWRIGFVSGNRRIIEALQKIKGWIDYGIYTPLQVAATIALNECDAATADIRATYEKRMKVMIESFGKAGWDMVMPKASMFIWAALPSKCSKMGSLEFSKRLLEEAKVAVSPGVGFGIAGENYVRIALIENEKRIRQAARNIKEFLKGL
ncbi:LL-diaminopimelate aminotransferase [Helicobacter saguini]|uniref:LL-diaminopimelate aminotransferase n=1 Tax=Helicobacter saguini TaxID=1548018 RepID=A0A347VN99_9HELI|nr:LL-diaminopimelate aminotransferase [Helicobacter saguini]MWV61847.1 LL-diaminopimelate aminotransferase [Helicobacter saguini]MWV67478.1 LL-diaminopimelate aminotransferase [Helicobacter saguini]MWV69829.1 LL-diaminopimelate aminotransferase [Helicobacter saguini]MWV72953.1 LL-diaminopimelate aminotransferase [Helicobacter saguini]TLD95664.1 LL-diaminopimelate aminotransferase [Helicobacter saguini]